MSVVPFNDLIYKKCSYNLLISIILYFKSSFYPLLANDIIVYSNEPNIMSLLPVSSIQVVSDEELLAELGLVLKEFEENISRDLDRFVKTIKVRLTQSEPILIPIDLYEMKTNTNWNIHYGVDHFIHDIMIIGYDDIRREFCVLDTDNRHCFTSKISYGDLYYCYMSYLSNCKWSTRKILSICKDLSVPKENFDHRKYKKIFTYNMLMKKNEVCEGVDLIPKSCDHALKLMSEDCIEKDTINKLLSNMSFSINLKHVQYYQIKEFYQECFEIVQYRREILDVFNVIKAIFMKFAISNNISTKNNMEPYFKELRRLEILCNNQFYHLADQEVFL